LVTLLRRLLAGASTQLLYKATHIQPLLAMVIGCGVTVLVQSSSITTSVLTPLAGVNVLSKEQMLPVSWRVPQTLEVPTVIHTSHLFRFLFHGS
jgi:sodium-dependent phosphate cotransporter